MIDDTREHIKTAQKRTIAIKVNSDKASVDCALIEMLTYQLRQILQWPQIGSDRLPLINAQYAEGAAQQMKNIHNQPQLNSPSAEIRYCLQKIISFLKLKQKGADPFVGSAKDLLPKTQLFQNLKGEYYATF